MTAEGPEKVRLIDYAVAGAPRYDEDESGDAHLVMNSPAGTLVAVVDGLGHGREAALAAHAAVDSLRRHAGEQLVSLVKTCHRDLKGTRGAVLGLALFHAQARLLELLGVGNVAGIVLRADEGAKPPSESVLVRAGLVGGQLPSLRPSVLTVFPGDVLIFATDGIRADFANQLPRRATPRQIAERIVSDYHKLTDDALVLVAKYVGES